MHFPLAVFGSIAYYREMQKLNLDTWETDEIFPKQTFRNRYTIRNSQGALRLTIPVVKPQGSKTKTKDILILSEKTWRNNHWRALTAAYAASPFFDHYSKDIEALVFGKHTTLLELAIASNTFIAGCLQLKIPKNTASQFDWKTQITSDFDGITSDDFQKYQQVQFTADNSDEFIANLSILDALFCLGPMARNLIVNH